MQRRTLVIRVGDHPFLRHVRDLYETLTSKYTSRKQPRGIASVFPAEIKAPFFFRKKGRSVENFVPYLKDKQSQKAFNEPLDENTELKIYIAGHSSSGGDNLSSLEVKNDLFFRIKVQTVARILHDNLSRLNVQPSAQRPVKISLICCYAAQGFIPGDRSTAFAARLLSELHTLGHNHILVKARDESVSAPFFGKKYTSGGKGHFYLADQTIYHVEKDNDLRKQVLKVLKKCQSKTNITAKADYLGSCINSIGELGYSEEDQKTQLRNILVEAKAEAVVGEFKYGTGWFMKIFNKKSNTETQIDKLINKIDGDDKSTAYNMVPRLAGL